MPKTSRFSESLREGLMASQKEYLQDAQETLGLSVTEMASLLATPLDTYKSWLYGRNPLPGIARAAIDCLVRNRPTGLE